MTHSLDNFCGDWTLSRVIDDALTGHQMRMRGKALFEPVSGGLSLLETGELTGPGMIRPLAAERRYLWAEASGLIAVFFEDGRYFHAFDPNEPEPCADHACDPDSYSVRYDFTTWPHWSATWTVRGPRKNYVSLTRFSPPLAIE